MELGGLVTGHHIPTVKTVLNQCIEQLKETFATFRVDYTAFRSGETNENPVEGFSGRHIYNTDSLRISASYNGPTFGNANLTFRSDRNAYEIRFPAPWDIDDSLNGITKLALDLLQWSAKHIDMANQSTDGQHSDIIGEDPFPWIVALSEFYPSENVENFALKTPSTPSVTQRQDDDNLIKEFDKHCPAFLRLEIDVSRINENATISLLPIEGDDVLFNEGISPIERMRAIAQIAEKGFVFPNKDSKS